MDKFFTLGDQPKNGFNDNHLMLGVIGRDMVLPSAADSDACPICGQPEDVEHIWRCQGDGVQKVWDDGIRKLSDWLERNNSHAKMKSAILTELENWQAGLPTNPQDFPLEVCAAIHEQNDIGWQNFFEGRISCEWRVIQSHQLL
jgi:hypothetical protein